MKSAATLSVKTPDAQREGYIFRPKWFLITRFFAVIGVILAILASRFIFNIKTLNYQALWIFAGVLLLSNICYLIYYRLSCLSRECDVNVIKNRLTVFTIIQINGDLILLTFMLHFSGGAANPFVFYYFFHTMISSILLSKTAAYFEAIFAALLFNTMTILEGLKIIHHYNLITPDSHVKITFILGSCFALTSALLIGVYMATSIMDRLRLHDRKLIHALEETARLEIEKSRFLDVVAHDLKEPLASIETMVNSTLTVFGDEIPSKVREVMERIPKRTGGLLKFIDELLDFSRIINLPQMQIQFKQLNFLPIVTATVEMYMSQALDKNINVSLNAEPDIPPIMGNNDHLERMVANLVSNAIRYTPENGSVNIKVSTENNYAILTVADTGIGIPEDALPSVFNDFFRAKNARKISSSGTGLGLSIIKTIVERHSGTITVQSTEGEGTVFTVKLPAKFS